MWAVMILVAVLGFGCCGRETTPQPVRQITAASAVQAQRVPQQFDDRPNPPKFDDKPNRR